MWVTKNQVCANNLGSCVKQGYSVNNEKPLSIVIKAIVLCAFVVNAGCELGKSGFGAASLASISPPPAPLELTTPSSVQSSSSELHIAGTCQTNVMVFLVGDDSQQTECLNGSFSFTVRKQTPGAYNFSVYQNSTNEASRSSLIVIHWDHVTPPPVPMPVAMPTITQPASRPFISNDSSLSIQGGCIDGDLVTLAGDASASMACSNSAYAFIVNKTQNQVYSFSITQSDRSGISSSPVNLQWTLDTEAPMIPLITFPLTNPLYSKANSVQINGTCEIGAMVYLTGAAALSAVCLDGSFSFNSSQSSDGDYLYSLVQTDQAGNTSSAVQFEWRRISSIQSPTITTPESSPTTTSASSFAIAGVCETDATVLLSGDDTQETTCVNSAFSFKVSKTADGTYSFKVSQQDKAGNVSPSSSVTWIRTTTVPAPVIASPGSASVTSNASSLTIAGTCTGANTIKLSGDSNQTTACTSDAFSFSVAKGQDGNYVFSISQADAYGNNSSSVQVTWSRDATPPAAPLITSPASNPFTTDSLTTTVVGTCESGAIVIRSGGGESNASQACASGQFAFTLTQTTTSGDFTYFFSQKDAAGNTSAATSFQWEIDPIAVPVPTVSFPNSQTVVTNDSTLTISGACTNTFQVNLAGSLTQDYSCRSNGTYSFTVTESIDGTYTYDIYQTDPDSSEVSSSIRVTWIRDATAPSAPVITQPSSAMYSSPGDLIIKGLCEVNATVSLSSASNLSTTCSSTGTFAFTVQKTTDGTYDFRVSQTDAAQNQSPSTSLTWTRASSLIPVPLITSPSAAVYQSNSQYLTISGTCDPAMTVVLSGNVSANDVVSPAGQFSQHCGPNGTFAYTISKAGDGTYDFFVQNQTAQGDLSPADSVQWVVDRTPPDTAISTYPMSINLNPTASFTFTSIDSTATFECSLNNNIYSTCSSPFTLASPTISSGVSYNLKVRARDSFGNVDPNAISYDWQQRSYATIALYHFDSDSQSSDSSLIGNHLTPVGVPGMGTHSSFGSDSGAYICGAKDYYTLAHNSSLEQLKYTMTVEAWINITANPSDHIVIASKDGASGQMGWEFGVKKGANSKKTQLYFIGSVNGTNETETASQDLNSSLVNKGWVHVAITWNKGLVNFYLGGSYRGKGTIGTVGSSSLNVANWSQPLTIGVSTTNATKAFVGAIDEVRISQTIRYTGKRTYAVPRSPFSAD